MDEQIFNKTIKLTSKEEAKTRSGTNTRVKLVDQEGTRFVFNKKKADGTNTQAYQQFVDMRLDEGSVVNIGYVLNSYEIEGKTITENKVISFREADGLDTVNMPSQEKSPRSVAPVRSQSQSKDTDWDQIAVGKCQTQFLAAYIQSGKTFDAAKLQVTKARKLAELVVYGTQQEELPTINQDDDPAGDFNPMVNDEPPIEAYGDIPY
jgi:hypothetical protein